jgi:hypothetical protein
LLASQRTGHLFTAIFSARTAVVKEGPLPEVQRASTTATCSTIVGTSRSHLTGLPALLCLLLALALTLPLTGLLCLGLLLLLTLSLSLSLSLRLPLLTLARLLTLLRLLLALALA